MRIFPSFKNNKGIIWSDSSLLILNKIPWELSFHEVHGWISTTDCYPDISLSQEELAYLNTIKTPSVAARFQSGRKLARYLLSCYLNISPEKINIKKTAFGKPFVEGISNIFFNITHTGAIIAIAISRQPIGIDLELMRDLSFQALATRFFSPQEASFFENATTQEHKNLFFQLWSAKEAALKANGTGIAHGLRKSLSTRKGEDIVKIHLSKKCWFIHPWSFQCQQNHAPDQSGVILESSFSGAIATASPQAVIRWYDWQSSVNNKGNVISEL